MKCIKCESENTILLPWRIEKSKRENSITGFYRKPRQIKCKACGQIGALWHWSKFWRGDYDKKEEKKED